MHSGPRNLQNTNCPSQKELIKVISVEEQAPTKSEAQEVVEQSLLRPDLGNISSALMEKTLLFYFESDLKIFWLINFSDV